MASSDHARPVFHYRSEGDTQNDDKGPFTPGLSARLCFKEENLGGSYLTTFGQHPLRQHLDTVAEGDPMTLRQEIRLALERLRRWMSIDFLRTGSIPETAAPTVFIMVPRNSTSVQDAKIALEEIWEACAKSQLKHITMALIIVLGEVSWTWRSLFRKVFPTASCSLVLASFRQ